MDEPTPILSPIEQSRSIFSKKKKVILLFVFVGLYLFFQLFIGSVKGFDTERIVEIKPGQSLRSIAQDLKEAGVVDSSSLLSAMIILQNGESRIISGVYAFERRLGAVTLAKRLLKGQTNIKALKITFPEGFTVNLMAERLKKAIPNFDVESFLKKAKPSEGFLFPDTYFFLPTITPEDVVQKMVDTFWQKGAEVFGFEKVDDISKSFIYPKIILASILEEEVQTLEDKKLVADLFLRRMNIGMPLQADSTLAYITGRDSLSLTIDDLKMENAYNSYKNRGLPPTPISNPGLESINAALNPTPNKYLYFLTDKEGKVYYAKTFEEHKKNKIKYLD